MKHKPNNKPMKIAVLVAHFFAAIFMLQAQSSYVGVIPGEIDVSPMGAATYTIPIEVVPGTQGMQPNLSIVYNSMNGMGLLGMKWGLAGISAITRCGQTLYFDSNITSIQFNTSDQYSLDGNRLIQIGSQLQLQFATEVENFMRIFPYNNTYDHFKAYADDGSIIEYGNTSGNTSNSKQKMGTTNNVLTWMVNKITDANGNTMTFQYGNSSTGEIWITKIMYNNNNSVVEFAYTPLPIPDMLGRNTSYVKGYAIEQSKLLQTITVKHNNTTVREYQFKYMHETNEGERATHLKEVILYGENHTDQLNVTNIIWGKQNNTKQEKLLSPAPQGYVITGDFNGDGYTDYVIYGQGVGQTTWKLYTRVPGTENFEDAGFTGTHTATSNEAGCFFYKADINGDACDELIIANLIDQELNKYEFKIVSLKDGNIKTINSKIIDFFYQIAFGDFSGDGKIGILFMKKDKNNNCTFEAYLPSYNGFITNLGFPNYPNSSCKMRTGDFNGDGKTDVELNFSNNNLFIYSFDNTYFYNLYPPNLYTQQTAEYNYSRYSGDFNGDGITDMLTYTYSTQSGLIWQLCFGKGDGTYTTNSTTNLGLNTQTETSPEGWTLPKNKIMTVDLDGDGKDEIIQISSPTLKILYSKGCINGNYIFSSVNQTISASFLLLKHFNIDDFNNDGILDLIVQKERINTPTAIYLHRNKPYEAVEEITDGFGKTLKFVFKPQYLIAKNGTVTKKYFYQILDKLQISNGLGSNLNSFSYQYSEPVFSYLRKTFLGFEKFSCTNQQENKKEQFIFAVDNSKFVMKPVSKTTYYYGGDWYETTYNFSFKDFGNKRYMPYANTTTTEDMLYAIKTVTTITLNATGRVETEATKIYEKLNNNSLSHSKTNTFSYETITLSGNQTKTVPTRILTQQQYGSTSPVIADTLSYGYYKDAANKGRLEWERKGNIDGSITTTYGNYLPQGVYQLKTISAKDCVPRSETFGYDDTRRFITKFTNPLGHETNFIYNAKTGNKTKETDPNGLITNYEYDVFGNLTKVTYPDNTKTITLMQWYSNSLLPNAKYYVTTKTDAKPDITVYYDLLGREVCRLDDGYYYETQYNNKEQVTKTSYPFGDLKENRIWHQYTYDEFGRISSEKAPYTDLSYEYILPFWRGTIITDNLREVATHKHYDALGRVWIAGDEGCSMGYNYEVTNTKRHETNISLNNGGGEATILSDLWGNRLSITDSDAGTITSEYNKLNELVKQTDANGNITTYKYDLLGRVIRKEFTAPDNKMQTIEYIYDTSNKGIGKLHIVKIDGVETEIFSYDNLSRLSQHKKKIDDISFAQTHTYNTNGQLQTLTYPDGFRISYSYTSTGKLDEIRNYNGNSLIYKVNSRNKYNQPTKCTYGNDVITEYDYDPYGLLTRINTGKKVDFTISIDEPGIVDPIKDKLPNMNIYEVDGSILNYNYTYNNKGLMDSRSESVINRKEIFQYDNLDRLSKTTIGSTVHTLSYASNGNIEYNSNIGTYSYGVSTWPPKPNAVTQIDLKSKNLISSNQCAVNYNFFNQPIQITEGEYELNLSYDANQQRSKMIQTKNNELVFTQYYPTKYQELVVDDTDKKHYYDYIYGDHGVAALHIYTRYFKPDTTMYADTGYISVERNPPGVITTNSMYYIHTDHLGSYCALTDANKKVVQRNCFDPWGNVHYIYVKVIEPFEMEVDSIYTGELQRGRIPINFTLTNRGFTGHEHYPYLKIINMNGRLYDPVIGRFFSPDNFVQIPEFSQSFNRYSYCLNNPLKYTDPSGEIIEYESFRDRWRSFWLRITDEEYRRQFRELRRSREIYVIKYNDDGKNRLSTDGNKLFVNYSMTDEAKTYGETRYSLLKHEFEHAIQFEHGELGFEHKDMGWGTVDGNGNYFEHREWKPVNYDIFDELKAQDRGASGSSWKSGTERDLWFKERVGDVWESTSESTRIERLRNTSGYHNLPIEHLNNQNDVKVKDYYFYLLPHKLRLY